jgi:GAF domain-containing protein
MYQVNPDWVPSPGFSLHMARKPPKKSTAKRRALSSRESVAALKKIIAAQAQELRQAAEQQEATSEVLRMIATAPADLQAVLDALAERAARLCESYDAVIQRVDGDCLLRAAHFGPVPVGEIRPIPISRGFPSGRAIVDRQTVHFDDVLSDIETEFPDLGEIQRRSGSRTVLATPLLSKGVPIGVIALRRTEVRPFSEKQIALLKTFADQAVIAIENVRLFKELQERNAELREALEHQTATAEVLGIISRSPTDVQPVLDAIVESAARVCGIDDVGLRLREGNAMVSRAHFGPMPIVYPEVSTDSPNVRWMREHGTLHIPDVGAVQNDFPEIASAGWRTWLAVPLRQQGEQIGSLNARRTEVRPFTPTQIKLLETFADQAVIAIENVRLFQELKESLEQQTATSEILGVIASSPTDIQPVLDVVVENASRLCDANDAIIYRIESDHAQPVAHNGPVPALQNYYRPLSRGLPVGRAIIDRQTIHIHDVAAEIETEFPDARALQRDSGTRTMLITPLMREDIPIGAISIRRTEVRPFAEKHISLLKTFAHQAVIAIENVRLFKEIQERNAELREALDHQTATSEVLGIISRSPTDVQPVLDAIVESAARVCGIDDLGLRLREGNVFVSRAHFGPLTVPADREEVSIDDPRFRWVAEHGTLNIPDARAQNDFPWLGRVSGARTFLLIPLRHQGEVVGTLGARRTEVRPFTPAQIKLLETFANQAVIALENVRLFQELKESLEQQTATSEILGVIASSPTDIQPVLDVVAENAARLCEATDASIYRVEGDVMRHVATRGIVSAALEIGEARPLSRGSVSGRAIVDCQPVHVHDMLADGAKEYPDVWSAIQREGIRTVLAVPLLREGVPIGGIAIRRGRCFHSQINKLPSSRSSLTRP